MIGLYCLVKIMFVLGFPGSIYGTPLRDPDYSVPPSRGPVDPYRQNPPLFRSNSDLNLDLSSSASQEQPLRREFGSADLVEAKQAGKDCHNLGSLITRPPEGEGQPDHNP